MSSKDCCDCCWAFAGRWHRHPACFRWCHHACSLRNRLREVAENVLRHVLWIKFTAVHACMIEWLLVKGSTSSAHIFKWSSWLEIRHQLYCHSYSKFPVKQLWFFFSLSCRLYRCGICFRIVRRRTTFRYTSELRLWVSVPHKCRAVKAQ